MKMGLTLLIMAAHLVIGYVGGLLAGKSGDHRKYAEGFNDGSKYVLDRLNEEAEKAGEEEAQKK